MAHTDVSADRQFYASAGDLDLTVLAGRGDRGAFAEIVRRTTLPVRRSLVRMGAEPAFAQDVTQDALLVALRKIHTYRGQGSLVSWLIRIAARLYIKQCKREGRFLLNEDLIDAEIDRNETQTVDQQLDFDSAMRLLSPAERLCVSLCYGAGFSHREIVERLGIPLGTVKSHISRGLEKLRRYMLARRDHQ